jgi:hypothetical protein
MGDNVNELRRLLYGLRDINSQFVLRRNDAQLVHVRRQVGTVSDEAVAALLREVRLLRELLSEIWRHRNGGSALSSSSDRHVTEALEGNGPA